MFVTGDQLSQQSACGASEGYGQCSGVAAPDDTAPGGASSGAAPPATPSVVPVTPASSATASTAVHPPLSPAPPASRRRSRAAAASQAAEASSSPGAAAALATKTTTAKLAGGAEASSSPDAGKQFTGPNTGQAGPPECIICMDALVNTVFVPCGHMAACSACAARLHRKPCPVCRKKIKLQQRVFAA
eukprot:NODE_10805_length_1328_cov_4.639467.p3 GENE.NODE_10805_length_1328_cov_4.639467~~NODE_10805_length_1328_cov_4.639467.p3  ORF type:complete len:188 (+),score=57.06 NODE_10805_length_1328_cov_4.639467:562-1125(+)